MENGPENKTKKERGSLENAIEKYKNIADAEGYEIDENALKSVALLNELDYFTESSCEGHLDHGLPYAWFDFGTVIDERESKLQVEGKSVYWDVYNAARNVANKTLEGKFPDYLGKYTDEMNDSWLSIFEEEKQKHPNYNQFLLIEAEMERAKDDTRKKVEKLISEYNNLNQNLKIHLQPKGLIRINCIPQQIDVKNLSDEEKIEMKKVSDLTLKKFEEFLQKKYENLT